MNKCLSKHVTLKVQCRTSIHSFLNTQRQNDFLRDFSGTTHFRSSRSSRKSFIAKYVHMQGIYFGEEEASSRQQQYTDQIKNKDIYFKHFLSIYETKMGLNAISCWL